MTDFLTFRKMITPILIQIVFWVAAAAAFIFGIVLIFTETGAERLAGLAVVFFGPLLIRIYAELLILLFRMNETLTEIKNNTSK